jgi:hypothetical protein
MRRPQRPQSDSRLVKVTLTYMIRVPKDSLPDVEGSIPIDEGEDVSIDEEEEAGHLPSLPSRGQRPSRPSGEDFAAAKEKLQAIVDDRNASAQQKIADIKAAIEARGGEVGTTLPTDVRTKIQTAIADRRATAEQKLAEIKQAIEEAQAGAGGKVDAAREHLQAIVDDRRANAQQKINEIKAALEARGQGEVGSTLPTDLRLKVQTAIEDRRATAEQKVAQIKSAIDEHRTSSADPGYSEGEGGTSSARDRLSAIVEDRRATAEQKLAEVKEALEARGEQASTLPTDLKLKVQTAISDARSNAQQKIANIKAAIDEHRTSGADPGYGVEEGEASKPEQHVERVPGPRPPR